MDLNKSFDNELNHIKIKKAPIDGGFFEVYIT